MTASVLATDLDGTLIPLDGNVQNHTDLQVLAQQVKQHHITLVFVTGRHPRLAREAITRHQLPQPDWLICDVGTTILQCEASDVFERAESYYGHLSQIVAGMSATQLRQRLTVVPGLRLQEPEKQSDFKLSYYTDADSLSATVTDVRNTLKNAAAPWSVIDSVDPFTGDGLIDLLPHGVSKSYALAWWIQQAGLNDDAVVFAGDSGNDLAALTSGYRAIVVGNASRALADQVATHHRTQGWNGRLHLATAHATSGVLEGCRRFHLMNPEN